MSTKKILYYTSLTLATLFFFKWYFVTAVPSWPFVQKQEKKKIHYINAVHVDDDKYEEAMKSSGFAYTDKDWKVK